MSRLNPPTESNLTPEQQQVHDAITSGPRGRVQGPLGIWLWRPELAQRAQALGEYCRYNSSLPAHLSELAILVTAQYWGSEFEWQTHKPIALKASLDKNIVEAIRTGAAPVIANADEDAVYNFATELCSSRRVSNSTYQSALDALGQEGVVDLVGILGYYSLISMTINVFEVDAPGADELA